MCRFLHLEPSLRSRCRPIWLSAPRALFDGPRFSHLMRYGIQMGQPQTCRDRDGRFQRRFLLVGTLCEPHASSSRCCIRVGGLCVLTLTTRSSGRLQRASHASGRRLPRTLAYPVRVRRINYLLALLPFAATYGGWRLAVLTGSALGCAVLSKSPTPCLLGAFDAQPVLGALAWWGMLLWMPGLVVSGLWLGLLLSRRLPPPLGRGNNAPSTNRHG